MFSLSATSSRVRIVTPRATTRRASSSRGAALVVRAEEKAAAAAPAPWTAPKLNPNTPSPIFGGSTGGLLRKAQVRSRARLRARFNDFLFGFLRTRRDE
jgi:photosystem I subunit 2